MAALTFIWWCAPLFHAQTGRKPQNPENYFEGSATSQQAG